MRRILREARERGFGGNTLCSHVYWMNDEWQIIGIMEYNINDIHIWDFKIII